MTPQVAERPTTEPEAAPAEGLAVYFVLGIVLGVIFIKSEVASWFRIQEMFHFRAVHMYGVIGSAIAVGATGVALLKRFRVPGRDGRPIPFPTGPAGAVRPNHLLGGICFGLGWGLVGACPGPLYALIGAGIPVMAVGLLAAVAGAWAYGLVRGQLPH